MKTKVCTKCGVEKAVSEFYNNKKYKDGLTYGCKQCIKLATQKNKNVKYCAINIHKPIYFKVCTKCKKVLHVDQFYKSKKNKNGLDAWCKKCNTRAKKRKYFCKVEIKHKTYFKACGRCGKLHNITYYHNDKYNKYGISGMCKDCNRIMGHNYTNKNREKVKSYQKEYYINNKDKIFIYAKDYYQNNKTIILKHNKKYRIENEEKIKKQKKIYRAENEEKIKKHMKEKIDNLEDSYVKSTLSRTLDTNMSYIPEGLIIAQRANLKLKRAIKSVRS